MAGFRLLTGAYRIPAAHVHVRTVMTNTVWVDAYRGAGRPECSYIIERLVDAAARETGLGRDEIRRRNLVPRIRDAVADAADRRLRQRRFPGQSRARARGRPISPASRRGAKRRAARGKLLGLGIAYYMEVTAAHAAGEGRYPASCRPDACAWASAPAPRARATRPPSRKSSSDRLGVDFDAIDFVTGDTDALTQGGGTGGAKSLLLAGTAVVDAAEKIIAKGKKLAGHFLEAAGERHRIPRWALRHRRHRSRHRHLDARAASARGARTLPAGRARHARRCRASSTGNKNTFPNGCHLCEIEIDAETGAAAILRYTVVDDFGVLVNPLIVEGQIHGGIVQGVGQILMEEARLRREAASCSPARSWITRCRARDDFPSFAVTFHNVPCTTNVLGIKGAGEAGTVGALGGDDERGARRARAARHRALDMPATPPRLWAAIAAAKR